MTQQGTFQKYFSQQEFKAYVRETTGREPVPVGPGLVFVFYDDEAEQAFLARKYRSTQIQQDLYDLLTFRRSPLKIYDKHQELLDQFWASCLAHGRLPEVDEFGRYAELVKTVGSPRRALRHLPYEDKQAQIDAAAHRRRDDTLVYVALNIFERRNSFSVLPRRTQRDVKSFFGAHKSALTSAREALFSAGNPIAIARATKDAVKNGVGVLNSDGDYTFHADRLDEQPPLIRIYVGCAEIVEEMPDDTDLVKLHLEKRAVSYLQFDDFRRLPLPRLRRRTRVKLATQYADDYTISDLDRARILFGKSYLVSEGFHRFNTQHRFDVKLYELGAYPEAGLGADNRVFKQRLVECGITLNGYRILAAKVTT